MGRQNNMGRWGWERGAVVDRTVLRDEAESWRVQMGRREEGGRTEWGVRQRWQHIVWR
jgi:hypothetical protein